MKYLRFRDLKERGIVNNWPSLKHRIEKNGFPPGQLIGDNARAWREDEVQRWLDNRPSAPKPGPKPRRPAEDRAEA
jgi:hypothetical protein